jgi:hypothetical protein
MSCVFFSFNLFFLFSFQIWAVNIALMLTVIWLHLVISFQRLAIIFFFMKYRKVFTSSLTAIIAVGAFVLGLIIVYAPHRAAGLPLERAGRYLCLYLID